jgi:hypothetical protein
MWALSVLAIAGSLAGAALLLPEQNAPSPRAPSPHGAVIIYRPPAPVRYAKSTRIVATGVVLAFLQSAVIRKHLGRSYDLVTPKLRQGLTRRSWVTGTIPVVPMPRGTDLRAMVLLESIRNELTYRVSLFPPKKSGVKPQLFDVTLRRLHNHWRVDSWVPSISGLYSSNVGASGPVTPNQSALPPASQRLSGRWAYGLIAFLVFALLIAPVGLGARALIEARRARAFRRQADASRGLAQREADESAGPAATTARTN